MNSCDLTYSIFHEYSLLFFSLLVEFTKCNWLGKRFRQVNQLKEEGKEIKGRKREKRKEREREEWCQWKRKGKKRQRKQLLLFDMSTLLLLLDTWKRQRTRKCIINGVNDSNEEGETRVRVRKKSCNQLRKRWVSTFHGKMKNFSYLILSLPWGYENLSPWVMLSLHRPRSYHSDGETEREEVKNCHQVRHTLAHGESSTLHRASFSVNVPVSLFLLLVVLFVVRFSSLLLCVSVCGQMGFKCICVSESHRSASKRKTPSKKLPVKEETHKKHNKCMSRVSNICRWHERVGEGDAVTQRHRKKKRK